MILPSFIAKTGFPAWERSAFFLERSLILSTSIAWLLTKEAQELNVESSYRYPVRTDVAAPEGLPALEDVDLVDYDRDQATAMRESVLEKFEAEIMANRT